MRKLRMLRNEKSRTEESLLEIIIEVICPDGVFLHQCFIFDRITLEKDRVEVNASSHGKGKISQLTGVRRKRKKK